MRYSETWNFIFTKATTNFRFLLSLDCICWHPARRKNLQGVFLRSDLCKTARQVALRCWFPMSWLSVPVLGFLSLLRLRVLFTLFLKLSEPVTHTLSFVRSVLFLGGFLSVLNCLLPFCKVLVILCHNSLCFAVSFHKCLYIRITVSGENIGEFI